MNEESNSASTQSFVPPAISFDESIEQLKNSSKNQIKELDYRQTKNLIFIMIATQQLTDPVFLQTILEEFPQLAKDSLSIEELKNLFVDISSISDTNKKDIQKLFKPDSKICLIHLYLFITKKKKFDIIKQLQFNDNNPFFEDINILEFYILLCLQSYFLHFCDSNIFKYLYKPEYITDTVKIYYCRMTDTDASILELIFSDNTEEKNRIVGEKENWTYLHVLIWNSSWDGPDEKKIQYDCYKQLVTDENKKIKDYEGRTVFDLYKEIYSYKIDPSIESLLR